MRPQSASSSWRCCFSSCCCSGGLLRGRSFTTVTGKGYSPAVMKLGKWRWVDLRLLRAVLLRHRRAAGGTAPDRILLQVLRLLSMRHADARIIIRAVFGSSDFWRGFGNTMLLGLVGATLTMLLGGAVAYISVRTRWRGRLLIDLMAWLPWMMPGIVLGLGFLWGFALLPHAIPIYGTIWALCWPIFRWERRSRFG